MHAKFSSENLKGRDHFERRKGKYKDNIKVDLKEMECGLHSSESE
jgi:hypothetical protein